MTTEPSAAQAAPTPPSQGSLDGAGPGLKTSWAMASDTRPQRHPWLQRETHGGMHVHALMGINHLAMAAPTRHPCRRSPSKPAAPCPSSGLRKPAPHTHKGPSVCRGSCQPRRRPWPPSRPASAAMESSWMAPRGTLFHHRGPTVQHHGHTASAASCPRRPVSFRRSATTRDKALNEHVFVACRCLCKAAVPPHVTRTAVLLLCPL